MTINNCLIFDFETLSKNQQRGVVTSLALLNYSTERFLENPYNFQELLGACHYIKFDIEEQVKKYNRVMDKETIDWWVKQGDEAKKQITPSSDDVSIDRLYDFLLQKVEFSGLKKIYTRGGSFDPNFLESVLADCGKEVPFQWRMMRDTRSFIEGMGIGIPKFQNDFNLKSFEGVFIKHDPRSDIVADVMRMQAMTRLILLDEWE
jgi:hypothetical protein